jgi:hypothetical protein
MATVPAQPNNKHQRIPAIAPRSWLLRGRQVASSLIQKMAVVLEKAGLSSNE